MNEVREKRGLTYGVSSSFQTMVQPGPFIIGLSTEKSQVNDALKVVDSTVAAFLEKGPTDAEMEAAKSHLTSSFVMNMEGNRKVLELITMVGSYNLPMDYLDTWTDKVKAVTAEDVRTAFGRKLSLEKMATVVVGE
jgi:zinc protease